ncbi:carbonic anhydrase 2-like, partial [Littorina saxatilis]|uniref:carbonic anhydrase 2-like n=1 Tax=Littorina saxatilis TaxID=31220 RepID=UPI0038B46AB6
MRRFSPQMICLYVTGAEWTYTGEHGVDQWAKDFPSYCSGQSQSPIDLEASQVTYDSDLQPFTFSNFDNTNGITWTLLNNGHAAQVSIGSGTMQVSGGSLGGTYQVAQFHFHWGSDSTKGSEHTVNGLAYPMELHIVCFNTKYGNLGDSLANPDALAVLGFFFE